MRSDHCQHAAPCAPIDKRVLLPYAKFGYERDQQEHASVILQCRSRHEKRNRSALRPNILEIFADQMEPNCC